MKKKQTKPQTLAEMYYAEKAKPTAAAQFIAETAKAAKVSEQAVRMWIYGNVRPSNHDTVEKIEKHFGRDIKTLFPNYDK